MPSSVCVVMFIVCPLLPSSFVVFSLGNKTYEQYNAMGRFVDKRLEEMGACRVFERGEGDDDGK